MDDYAASMHRVAVRDITMAWAIAVMLLAVLLALPNDTGMNSTDSAETGTKGNVAETIPHDTNGPMR